jgi:hypothetical protein
MLEHKHVLTHHSSIRRAVSTLEVMDQPVEHLKENIKQCIKRKSRTKLKWGLIFHPMEMVKLTIPVLV